MYLNLRISSKVKDKIRRKAEANGLSISAYVRLAALNYEAGPQDRKERIE